MNERNERAKNFARLSIAESYSFDTIRAFSAFIVTIAHGWQFFINNHFPLLKGSIGIFSQGAVAVFFAMSGFLIGKSIQLNIIRNNSFLPAEYFSSRARRIYPPLLLSILLLFFLSLVVPLTGVNFDFEYKNLFASLLFVNNFLTKNSNLNFVLWTLSFEVWCYILIGLFFAPKNIYKMLSIAIFVTLFTLNYRFFGYFLIWIFGFSSSYLHNNLDRVKNYPIILLFLASLAGLFFFGVKVIMNDVEVIDSYNLMVGMTFTTAILLFMKTGKFKLNFLSSSARYSYTLYIVHMPILIALSAILGLINGRYFEINLFTRATVMVISLYLCVLFARKASDYVENKVWIKKTFG